MTDANDQWKNVNDSLRVVNENMLNMTKELSCTKTNTKNLWHEMKNIRKDVKALPAETQELIDRHSDHCLAREKVKMKIMSESAQPRSRERFSNGNNFFIPKWMLITFVIVGAVLVGGGIMVGAFLTDSQKAAQGKILNIKKELENRSGISRPANK